MNLNQSPWPVERVRAPHRAAKRPLRIKLYLLLLVLDTACVLAGFVSGALLRFGEVFVDGWVGVTASVVALYMLSAITTGAYSLEVLRHPARGTARAIGCVLLAFALLFLLFYFLKVDQRVSRVMTGTSFIVALLAIALVRQFVGDAIRKAFAGNFTTEILLYDGPQPPTPEGMIAVDAARADLRPRMTDAAMQIRLAELLQGVDRIVISCSRRDSFAWSQVLKSTGTQGEVFLRDYDELAPLGVAQLDGRTTLVVSAGPLNVRQRLAKRAFDFAFTIPVLVMLLPVLAVIALAIKLDSRGPVLFRQPRVGCGNTLFEIFKFRTMAVEKADLHGNLSARRDDDRLTRVGSFLRRTSLDELPQFLNVLLGSMSIVGPRPHALGSLAGEELFWDVDQRYWQRHVLKPGITGLAQVRGFRGATHTREHLTSRLQADLEYISGWSLWRDVAIVARTLRVLTHKDAF